MTITISLKLYNSELNKEVREDLLIPYSEIEYSKYPKETLYYNFQKCKNRLEDFLEKEIIKLKDEKNNGN